MQPPGPSRVSIEISLYQGIVRPTVTHDRLVGEDKRDALVAGWAVVLSNLKTLMGTAAAACRRQRRSAIQSSLRPVQVTYGSRSGQER